MTINISVAATIIRCNFIHFFFWKREEKRKQIHDFVSNEMRTIYDQLSRQSRADYSKIIINVKSIIIRSLSPLLNGAFCTLSISMYALRFCEISVTNGILKFQRFFFVIRFVCGLVGTFDRSRNDLACIVSVFCCTIQWRNWPEGINKFFFVTQTVNQQNHLLSNRSSILFCFTYAQRFVANNAFQTCILSFSIIISYLCCRLYGRLLNSFLQQQQKKQKNSVVSLFHLLTVALTLRHRNICPPKKKLLIINYTLC